jgi:hypothetical protein
VPNPAQLYLNLWRTRDGSHEASTFARPADALEEIAAEYPGLTYAGTVTLSLADSQSRFEDWSAAAHHYAIDATQDWLDEQRERQAHRQNVL